ncbi:MAG TPA: HAMP domain-containing sensor histidine kinase [Hyphomicrobium sp.]|nr:HAMP domain-containing sensor histidine kinase [Hyphomicrobium sp.]
MKSGSLRLRLAAGGALAIAVALIVTGVGLGLLFERHALRSLADNLEVDLRQILGAIEIDADGKVRLLKQPSDPRFSEPLSGLYWQISAAKGATLHSRSLWDFSLPLPSDTITQGEVHRHRVNGPAGGEILAVEQTVLFTAQGQSLPVRATVAADINRVTAARSAFIADLIPSLLVLGAVLSAATWIQIGLGLRPLLRLRDAVGAVRQGTKSKIDGSVPSEVEPLVNEINSLLASQAAEIGRSRARASDLAHGLKTPLAALTADARELRRKGDPELATRIEEVGEVMRRHVERELVRARIHGTRGKGERPSTHVFPLVASLVTMQKRTLEGAHLTFEIDCAPDASVAMEKYDLAEVLGNLIENASRHAHTRVRVALLTDGRMSVEDDGPGIPKEKRAIVLERGQQLDRKGDGAGLGLAIVQEVLDANGRRLKLDDSPLGGLRATF